MCCLNKQEKLPRNFSFNTIIFFLFALVMASCVKNHDLVSPQEGTIYMPQAYQDRATMTIYKVDSIQGITFGAAYSGFKSASTDITVEFQVDTSLVTAYNASNAAYLGYSYHAIPADAYTVTSTTGIIPAGRTSTDSMQIMIDGSKLSFGVRYLLPVRLVSASSGAIDSSLSIAYFKLDTLLTRSRDLTSTGTLTVSDENSGGADAGEGSKKLVDNDYGTKFLSFDYNPNFWTQLHLSSAQKLDAYTITSGNDAPERDPKTWQFQGSNDGVNWTTLDTRTNESFFDRLLTRRFDFSTTEAYSYYRLYITENGGSGLIQITEWRLLQYY